MFAKETMERKTVKYQSLIMNIAIRRWNEAPIIVLAAKAKTTLPIPLMKKLELN